MKELEYIISEKNLKYVKTLISQGMFPTVKAGDIVVIMNILNSLSLQEDQIKEKIKAKK